MDFITAIKTCFTKYFDFKGRARRSEYWWFVLLNVIIGCIPVIGWISILLIIPGLAVAVRRLHDIGRSGWWYLLMLVPILNIVLLFIWFAKEGEAGTNKWGANPKA